MKHILEHKTWAGDSLVKILIFDDKTNKVTLKNYKVNMLKMGDNKK